MAKKKPGTQATRAAFSELRAKLSRRVRDARRAGYNVANTFKTLRDVQTANELRNELRKMQRAWKSGRFTSTWAAQEEEKEIKSERRRVESARKAAERLQRTGNLTQNEKNLLSGLAKYGIKITSKDDLAAWGAYISYRKSQQISNAKYEFDKWVESIDEISRKARVTGAELLKDFALFTADMRRTQERARVFQNRKEKIGSSRVDALLADFRAEMGL